MRILMLNYEYPPLGGGGSNACKYKLKEFTKKNLEADVGTFSKAHIFENEKMGSIVSPYKLSVNDKDISYFKNELIIEGTIVCLNCI